MLTGIRGAAALMLLMLAVACGDENRMGSDAGSTDGAVDAATDGAIDGGTEVDAGDAAVVPEDAAACAITGSSQTELEREPVDIIWVVDNSSSMSDSITAVNEGLSDFAELIAESNLDYRVIMLSNKGSGALDICIPQPLAGDDSCGDDTDCSDGGCFFHVDLDVYSTQPLEQILGTLAQTAGYTDSDSHGSAPWLDLLRPNARKSFVIVTDDNQRTCDRDHNGDVNDCSNGTNFTTMSFEDYPGGPNPFGSSRVLGEGILSETYGDLFEGYVMNAIYGWGSETDPDVVCGSTARFPWHTYTYLVERTGGVRAQICDQATVWTTFFQQIADRVNESAGISCEFVVPEPPEGQAIDRDKVNVYLQNDSDDPILIRGVDSETACGVDNGWYYGEDAEGQPTVQLCPTTCTIAEDAYHEDPSTAIEVQFGCATVVI